MDRELADDGAVEFVADDGDGLVAVDDARFQGQGVEGDALTVLEQRGIVDTGFAEEVIDIVAGEIAFELAVEFDLLPDEMQPGEIGLGNLRFEIEFGLFLAVVDQSVEMGVEVRVACAQLPVEFIFGYSAVNQDMAVCVVVELQVIYHYI